MIQIIGDYKEGFAVVRLANGDYTFIDSKGNLQNGRYKWADSYSDGLARVRKFNGKFAFIDKEGKIHNEKYRFVDSYHDGFARIRLDDGKYAFIDKFGNMQNGKYIYADSYNNGFACVFLEIGKKARVDKFGNLDFSEREWMEVIKQDPSLYEFIPPEKFDNQKFMDNINHILLKKINKIKKDDIKNIDNGKNENSSKGFNKSYDNCKEILKIVKKKNQAVVQAKENMAKLVDNTQQLFEMEETER